MGIGPTGIGAIGERLRRSTVLIRSGNATERRSDSGSGIVWDTGAIITNAHVARSGDLTVEFWDGRAAQATLLKRDVRRDLAILRCDATGSEPARYDDARSPRVGEFVIAVGNPLGFIGALSTGVIHGVGLDFVQTTARLAPGNSGGPLADADGFVIGINTAVSSAGLGLAVPASAVKRLLTSGPQVELGVTIRPVRIQAGDRGIGLLVLAVAAGSAADYASLRIGDLLIAVDGKRFASVGDLQTALNRWKTRPMSIQFLRGGDSRQREVTIRAMQGVAA
jgi:serine protease Do